MMLKSALQSYMILLGILAFIALPLEHKFGRPLAWMPKLFPDLIHLSWSTLAWPYLGALGAQTWRAIMPIDIGLFRLAGINISLPLECLLVVAIYDLVFYWGHRLQHYWSWMWRLHRVHHSIKAVTWLTGFRIHPVDFILFRLIETLFFYSMGFSPKAVAIGMSVFGIISMTLHINTKFNFKRIRPWLGTPHFHQWHHQLGPKSSYGNFAILFPWIDRLFGTYIDSPDWPDEVGITFDMPETFVGQMISPLKDE